MADSRNPKSDDFPKEEADRFRQLLGYLNFSEGKPDSAFQKHLNELFPIYDAKGCWSELRQHLLDSLERLEETSEAFANATQARAVIQITFDELLPVYREFHRDLLFHVPEEMFQQPFFLARVFEAVLAQGGPWEETDRVTRGAMASLNNFLGYRPVAVLENEQQMEPYPHERYRPVPIYIRGAGVAHGPYEELIAGTIQFFQETPREILLESYFDLDRMEELAVDIRAHDHLHPVNKRTNYMFGEWDPHQINNQGFYTRFIIRKIILDALLHWMADHSEIPREELLYDAAAVLCGTALMASSISGAGPDTHSSDVSLTSLLPKVARQRDAFYERLIEQAEGKRAERLLTAARMTQQPFGHVRQYLNMHLARYGANQVQHRQIANLYARMGFTAEARQQASIIPSTSARFETEIECLVTAAHLKLEAGKLEAAAADARELESLLHRGIECGAFVDPWNILGFQAQFPLFTAREDSVPDHRAEILLSLMESVFGVFSQVMGEAAAQGNTELQDSIKKRFHVLAHFWDRYATTTIEDLPQVSGNESYLSASRVSSGLLDWRDAGEEAGNISFWRTKVTEFESAKAYSLLVTALIGKQDYVAAMALCIHWLSEADTIGLESGLHSIHDQFRNWVKAVSQNVPPEDRWSLLSRFFDYIEVNAGPFWDVPTNESLDLDFDDDDDDYDIDDLLEPDFEDSLFDDDEDDDEDNPFEASFGDIPFQDSAEDGVTGETLDGGYSLDPTEFELLYRELEPHLKFVLSLSQMWQMASTSLNESFRPDSEDDQKSEEPPLNETQRATILNWYRKAIDLQKQLTRLLVAVWEQDIEGGQGDHDSNVEYDIQLQSKFHLLYAIINSYVNAYFASWSLLCLLGKDSSALAEDPDERLMIDYFRAIFQRQTDQVRALTPRLLERFRKHPLLYVPFENGGQPGPVLAARRLQTFLRFLLTQLPQMGLVYETYEVLYTAYRMEREHRPAGPPVTEFDQLFRTAISSTLKCVVTSSEKWKSGRYSNEELTDLVSDIVEHYLELWLKHSRSMRLSTVEALSDDETMNEVREFIIKYGADLFHARMLSLGNVRAILHSGIEPFLDHLANHADPLHPIHLIEDLEENVISRDDAIDYLELIYGSVVDKFDRFLEYNSTTTHSDYGEKFFCFLDFLRVEADYERDAWKMAPVAIAHEVLCRQGKRDAAMMWEHIFQLRSAEMAEQHIKKLRDLQSRYGMTLPSLADHLEERFVKPLAVNRMLALVPRAVEEVHDGEEKSPAFEDLRAEIEAYLATSAGSAVDIPLWLKTLEKELDQIADREQGTVWNSPQPVFELSQTCINLRDMKRQMKLMSTPVKRPKKSNKTKKASPPKPPPEQNKENDEDE
ncbi:MAG: hypothetical protein HUJ26_04315 [Planctomycetaceae bacterium]|nr:hypothetical protein [Planctomycetaceae bacterium]